MRLDKNLHGLWCLQMTLCSVVRAGSSWKSRELEVCTGKKRNEGLLQQDRIHVYENTGSRNTGDSLEQWEFGKEVKKCVSRL